MSRNEWTVKVETASPVRRSPGAHSLSNGVVVAHRRPPPANDEGLPAAAAYLAAG